MLHAYFDESGKFTDPHSHFICLAGYIATDSQWQNFIDEWHALLNKHCIPYVHMKDMIALQGEYKHLGWSHAHRDEVLKEFIYVIRHNVSAAFEIGLDAKYYRAMPREAQRRIGGADPFLFSFERLIELVVRRLTQMNLDHNFITMAFDDDKDYAMRCYSLWCKLKKLRPELGKYIKAMCFADDQVYPPLQAADILAYETNKFMHHLEDNRNPRATFLELLKSPEPNRGIEFITEVWNGDELNKMTERDV